MKLFSPFQMRSSVAGLSVCRNNFFSSRAFDESLDVSLFLARTYDQNGFTGSHFLYQNLLTEEENFLVEEEQQEEHYMVSAPSYSNQINIFGDSLDMVEPVIREYKLDNLKIKRRRKMNKHKYRKMRKKQRYLRKKLGK